MSQNSFDILAFPILHIPSPIYGIVSVRFSPWEELLDKERVRAGIGRSGFARRNFDAGEPREQFFILIRDLLPVVTLVHARHRAMAVFADDRGVIDDALQIDGQFLSRFIDDAGVADDFRIFRSGESERAIARAHRFDQRRVCASDLCGVDVAIGVLLQRPVVFAEDKPQEFDSGSLVLFNRAMYSSA